VPFESQVDHTAFLGLHDRYLEENKGIHSQEHLGKDTRSVLLKEMSDCSFLFMLPSAVIL
jgi:hypothetical protein